MKKIPVTRLKQMSKDFGLDHIIVFATGNKKMFIATYGRTVEECSEAADFGNRLKDVMGWPESLHQQPSRVKRLQLRVKELEAELKECKK